MVLQTARSVIERGECEEGNKNWERGLVVSKHSFKKRLR